MFPNITGLPLLIDKHIPTVASGVLYTATNFSLSILANFIVLLLGSSPVIAPPPISVMVVPSILRIVISAADDTLPTTTLFSVNAITSKFLTCPTPSVSRFPIVT